MGVAAYLGLVCAVYSVRVSMCREVRGLSLHRQSRVCFRVRNLINDVRWVRNGETLSASIFNSKSVINKAVLISP